MHVLVFCCLLLFCSVLADPRGGATPAFGADMLGLIPWSEFQAHLDDVNGNGRDDEDRIFPVASYLSDGRVQSRLPVGGNPEYLHGDLTHSTMLRTNPVGGAIPGTGGPGGGDGAAVLGYTAFGEPIVRNGGTGVPPTIGGRLPAAMHRYAYVGGLGYEQDTMVLAGSASSPLPPITLSHVGQRWYQPGLGRWAQRDPIGLLAGLNRYSYSLNQPITGVDPTGLEFSMSGLMTSAGIMGTLAGGLGGAVGGLIGPDGPTLGGVLGGALAGAVTGGAATLGSVWIAALAGAGSNGPVSLGSGESWSDVGIATALGGLGGALAGKAAMDDLKDLFWELFMIDLDLSALVNIGQYCVP